MVLNLVFTILQMIFSRIVILKWIESLRYFDSKINSHKILEFLLIQRVKFYKLLGCAK